MDTDPDVHRYLGNILIHSLEEARDVVGYIINQYKDYGIGRWAVIEKDTNEFVGWSGLKYEREVRDEMDYYDLGYRLKPKFWGKGIATESSLAALSYGFEKLELDTVYAGAHVDNIASNRVLQKLGMQNLEIFEYDGMPHYWYRIKDSEFRS